MNIWDAPWGDILLMVIVFGVVLWISAMVFHSMVKGNLRDVYLLFNEKLDGLQTLSPTEKSLDPHTQSPYLSDSGLQNLDPTGKPLEYYRPVHGGDRESVALAIAYELWRAELLDDLIQKGPKTIPNMGCEGLKKFNDFSACRIAGYAHLILKQLNEGGDNPIEWRG